MGFTGCLHIYQEYLRKNGREEKADESISEFLNGVEFNELQLNQGSSQKVMMVAANFRKEVTSTALWLMNYKLRIQCFKVTPYSLNDNLFLDFEQIIPVKGVEEYTISMAEKAQEDIEAQESGKARYALRTEFWTKFLKELSQKSKIYENISPSKDNWIATGSGISSVSYNSVISNHYSRVELYITRPSKEENKLIFDTLNKSKDDIEKSFGDKLIWERLDDRKACRIKYQMNGVDYFDRNDWEKMITFMVDNLPKLEQTFNTHIRAVSNILKKLG